MSKFRYNAHKFKETDNIKTGDLILDFDTVPFVFLEKKNDIYICKHILTEEKKEINKIYKIVTADVNFDKKFEEKDVNLDTTSSLKIFDIIEDRNRKIWLINDILNEKEIELVRFPIVNRAVVVNINLDLHKLLIKKIYKEVKNDEWKIFKHR